MKHLIILFLLILPLIACQSTTTYRTPPPPPPPPPVPLPVDPVISNSVIRAIAELDKITEWDSRKTEPDDQYVIHTFTKTYSSGNTTQILAAVHRLFFRLNSKIKDLIRKYGDSSGGLNTDIAPYGNGIQGSARPYGKKSSNYILPPSCSSFHASHYNDRNQKIRAELCFKRWSYTLNMTLTLLKRTQ